MCAGMSAGDGEVTGVIKGLLAFRESFGLLEGSDPIIRTQQTCMHHRISDSVQVYCRRAPNALSAIFPHNTGLKLTQFRNSCC
jgi:hypothetical protein